MGSDVIRGFSRLKSSEHMLKWLADEPFVVIRSHVEEMLQQQVPGSRLVNFCVISDPQCLTGVRRVSNDSNKTILVRTGIGIKGIKGSEPKG